MKTSSVCFARGVLASLALPLVLAAQRGAPPNPVAQPPALSGPVDTAYWGDAQWRNIGPNSAGRMVSVAGSVARPKEYYFGTTGGGVWKTTDGGTTLVPVTDKYFGGSIGALAVSESNPDIVFAGGGETQIRGNVSYGDGVWKTTDGGKTWTSMGLKETQYISRIRIHPTNPDIVYVGALGHVFGAELRARRLQDDRRRQDVEEDSLPQRLDRRRRSHHGAGQSERAVRDDLAGGAQAVAARERRRGQRDLQDDRRRRSLDGDHAQSGASVRRARQDGHRDFAGEAEPRVGADRERAGRRRVSLRRRRRDVEVPERLSRSAAARVVLLEHLRRSEGHERRRGAAGRARSGRRTAA